jgi:Spy/CpxP family protein refolding chaperone
MLRMLPLYSSAIALSAALAFAQGPGTPPEPATMAQMRVDRLANQLTLTDSQKATALSIYTTAHTAAQPIQISLQASRTSISDAVKSNNTAAIDQLAVTSGTLDGQLTAINSKAEAAFFAILTTDQQTKYASISKRGPGGTPPGTSPNMRFGRGGQ